MLQVLHNPRCGKSRNCLAFLKENNKEFEIISYLDTPLSPSELKKIVKKLNLKPIDIVRKKESIWIEKYKGKELNDEQVLEILATYPILIERPIVIDDNNATIGREIDILKNFI